jgi:hypothetical protein
MLKYVVPVLSVLATHAAASFQVGGRVSEAWDSHEFVVSSRSERARLWFTVPTGCIYSVAVRSDSGEPAVTRVNMTGPVQLKGVGRFTVTVTYDSGAGEWRCQDAGGDVRLLELESYVDPKHPVRFRFDTELDETTWRFSGPADGTFLVRNIGAGGRAIEEQDMADAPEFEFLGTGTFTVEVAAADGAGRFSATLKE